MDAGQLAVDREFASIYEASFPPAEREPLDVIVRSLRDGGGFALRQVSDARTTALATAQLLPGVPAVFLVYIAVRADLRSTGAGGALLEALVLESRLRLPSLLGLVWEVDRVGDATEESEKRRRQRRIEFFHRHGGFAISDEYLQPAVNGRHIVPMHLFFRPTVSSLPAPSELVSRLTQGIYLEKYAKVNGMNREHLEDLLQRRLPPRPAFAG